jgi:ArsR family transcriptional regulator, arsenate/arsenite/antimonite-responsive transcriptional repressor
METKAAVTVLAALAQPSRLGVFRLLVVAAPEGIAAGDLASELSIPPATMTFHLKELLHAGLVESRREGRSIRYSLCVSQVRALLEFLMEDCCQGRAELCGTAMPTSCCEKPTAKKKVQRKRGK